MRALPLAAAAALAAASASGQAVRQVDSLEGWLAEARSPALAQACDAQEALGPAPDGRVWLTRGADGLALLADGPVSPEAAAWWSAAVLGARALAEALYAAADGAAAATLMIEAQGGALRVFDGVATQALSGCAATAALAAALGGAPSPVAARPAPPPAAPAAQALVVIAAGGTATLELSDLGVDGPAVLRGPPGVSGAAAAAVDGVRPQAVLSAAPDAAPGAGVVRVYAADDPFTVLATAPLEVRAGGGGTAPAALAPGGRVAGAAPLGGVALVPLTLAEAGAVTLRSRGGDMAATLRDASGAALARADDGAPGYGFALSARLDAGEYMLEVGHCCGGGGRFEVEAAIE